MEFTAYLYDSDGNDRNIDLEKIENEKIGENQLLWVNVRCRKEEIIKKVASALKLRNVPLKSILNDSERPQIDIFEDFYRIYIVSVKAENSEKIERLPIDFLVGKNFVVTIHDGKVDYFDELREREKGETNLGELDVESFITTLLDLHIVSYFRALEEIEERVDELDETVLQSKLETHEFLAEVVRLRQTVSKLRRWFLPHRDVFYALSRPNFQQLTKSDSVENFKMLNQHFESAVDAIESSRDTVLSLFDLYATKSAQLMNVFIQRLTFITLLVGCLGALAGIWGMNFEVEYFKMAEYGFWLTIGSMLLLVIVLTIIGKIKKWI